MLVLIDRKSDIPLLLLTEATEMSQSQIFVMSVDFYKHIYYNKIVH